ncbi:hypothetical protein ACTFRV_25145 [Bacillus cereus group sp. MYBK185-1]|uniref:hypothetical protein n=1 Tax=Bacillus cereus group sp. MYBK185-1 TaxID=3450672 RepID=UPI003F7A1E8A
MSLRSDVKVERIIGNESLPRLVVIHASGRTVTEIQNIFGSRIVITLDKQLEHF